MPQPDRLSTQPYPILKLGYKAGTQLANTLFGNLPVAIYTCDARGYIVSYNNAAEILWGRTPKVGKDRWCGASKIYYPDGEPMLPDACPMARALKKGVSIEGEEIIIERPDNTKVKVRTYPVPIFDDNDVLTGAVNTLIDVSSLKEGEEKQALLAAIVNTSDDTIISKSLAGIITSWNDAAEKMFGYTSAEALGKHISLIIPPARLQEEDLIISLIVQGNKVDHFETIRIAKDGTHIPVSLSVSPVMDKDGNIIGASKIARDIREKKTAEEKQAILAAIIDTSDDAIISKTLKGVITSWNKAAEHMFGYTEAEAVGKHISLIIPPARLKEEEYIIGQINKRLKIDHFETIRVRKDGREIPISLSVSPIMDSKGNLIGASKIARDISAQLEAFNATKRYTERLEVINVMVKAVSEELDLNKVLQKVTDATTALTGAKFGAFFYNTANNQGESFMLHTLSGAPKEVFDEFGMPTDTAMFDAAFSREGVVRVDDITKDPRFEKNARYPGNAEDKLQVVSYLAVPVISRAGNVIGGLFLGHPKAGKFTEEHENILNSIAGQTAIGIDNAKLYQEVKELNGKKDEFIGLASHELKTPLTSVSGYLQILNRLKTDEATQRFVSKTIQQVKKLTALVSDLLDVSKIEAGKLQLALEAFDIRKVVEDAVELIQTANNGYEISLETDINGLTVNGDSHRIEQVIMNLLANAVKYSPGANKVVVLLAAANNEIKIGVKDFGVGIAEDKLTQVFSRFYRIEDTNPNISGLGIGLFLAHEIITRHNGKLWVESELGKGSTFWFTLPL